MFMVPWLTAEIMKTKTKKKKKKPFQYSVGLSQEEWLIARGLDVTNPTFFTIQRMSQPWLENFAIDSIHVAAILLSKRGWSGQTQLSFT